MDILQPYTDAGSTAVTAQGNLLGLNGDEAQGKAIKGIEDGPQFEALVQQGENAMLQNASATGGLRGGNLEAAMAKFRPQILSSLIQSQFSNLGSLSALGQASGVGQGAAAQHAGDSIANLFTQIGQAQAGASLAVGNNNAAPWGVLAKSGGNLAGAGLKGLKFS